jgi:(heptosyl)LPS beta-1,4-glucosyltransferase
VLSLDSDEVMSEALIDSIEGLTFEDHKVYLLNRSNYFCGKQIRFSNWSPDHIPRLFNKKVASWAGDFVHEKLSFGDNVKKELLNGRLDHYSYESYSQRMDKVFNYAKLSAHERFQKGKRTNLIWTILTSISKFIITYFIHLGFLDGKAGFQIALTDALGSWKRNRIMMELQNNRVPECCK